MKVAIFTDTFVPQTNGVVSSIRNLAKGLVNKNIDVVIFAPGKTTHMEYIDGAKVYFFKARPLRFLPDYMVVWPEQISFRFSVLLEMEKPDIFHVQTPFTVSFAGSYYSWRFKKPLVGTFHTLLEDYAAYFTKGNFQSLMKKTIGKSGWPYFRTFFNRCSATIAPLHEMAKLLKEKRFRNIVVIPNGIDFSRVNNKKRFDIRRLNHIPKNAKIILHLGRISFEKKIDILLKSFKEMDRKDVYLLVVGSGPSLKNYEKLAKKLKLKNIRFTGYVDDKYIASYYNSADVFATPSDTEICPMVVLEAFAAGKPVVGPDHMGTKDLIIDNYNGFKFKRGDQNDLTGKLLLLLNNKRLAKQLGKHAKKYSEKYSIEKTTARVIELYKKVKYRPYRLKDLLAFWPSIKFPPSHEFKNGGLISYLRSIKFQF